MVYIIFTREGLQQLPADLTAENVTLWVNDPLISTAEKLAFEQQGLCVNILPEYIDVEKEKSVLSALDFVEKQVAKNTEIFIEYI